MPKRKPTQQKSELPFDGEKRINQGYDKTIRNTMNKVFIPIILRLMGLEKATIKEHLPDKIQSIEQRETDLLLLLVDENGEEFILHIEFQTTPDYQMRWRLSEYHGLLLNLYKLPIRHCIVELYEEDVQIEYSLSEKYQFKGADSIHFHDLDTEQFLSSQVPNEIVLAVLANFEGKDPDMVLKAIHKRLLQTYTNDAELKKAVLNLETFGNMRNLQHQIIKIKMTMPLHFDINDNPQVRDMLYAEWRRLADEALSKGVESAIEKSLLKTTMSLQEIADFYEVSLFTVIMVKDRLVNLKQLDKNR